MRGLAFGQLDGRDAQGPDVGLRETQGHAPTLSIDGKAPEKSPRLVRKAQGMTLLKHEVTEISLYIAESCL